MLATLKAKNPKLILVMTTPIAQSAKSKIHNIPLIYTVITDPVEAGLIKETYKADINMTGSSDMQDLKAFLKTFDLKFNEITRNYELNGESMIDRDNKEALRLVARIGATSAAAIHLAREGRLAWAPAQLRMSF